MKMIMTVNEVFNNLGSFLIRLINESDWLKAELFIDIQPGVLGMGGKCFTDKKTFH
ncbi:MAG TPA: hypothetical protein VIK89_02505 [Cytophagaceae bacterium]